MAETNLEWVEELDEDEVKPLLDRDSKLIYEHCNLDTLLDLLANLRGIPVYLSHRSLERIQQYYIAKNFKGDNHKELAAKLGCSRSYVYKTLKQLSDKQNKDQMEPDLFERQT